MVKSGQYPPLSFTGKPLYHLLWDRMDAATDRVMGGKASEREIGKALGLAEALAVFTNPYTPNPKAIREQAKDRWKERNNSEEDE